MNKKVLLSSSLVLVALASYASFRDPVTIAWKPKVGDSFAYKYKSTIASADIQSGADLKETIKAIGSDGNVIVEDKTNHLTMIMGGNDMSNSPGIPTEITETLTEAPNGHVLKRQTDFAQGDMPRVNALSQFIYPDHAVNQGDTWTYKGTADKTSGANDFEEDFTYQGKETLHNIDCNKVGVTVKETNTASAITGSGTVWLDAQTGAMVKLSVKLKNVDVPGLGTTDLASEVERTP
jgi:hypothetical protein